MPFGIGHWELVALAVVALLLFGSSRLPQIARQVGRGTREARKEYLEVKRSFDVDDAVAAPKAPAEPAERS